MKKRNGKILALLLSLVLLLTGCAAREGGAIHPIALEAVQALTEIAAAHPGETVAVASHGCAIRNALCWAKGWPIERLSEVAWCDNTGVSVLRFDRDRVELILENDNTHLNEELSTFAKQTWWKE